VAFTLGNPSRGLFALRFFISIRIFMDAFLPSSSFFLHFPFLFLPFFQCKINVHTTVDLTLGIYHIFIWGGL